MTIYELRAIRTLMENEDVICNNLKIDEATQARERFTAKRKELGEIIPQLETEVTDRERLSYLLTYMLGTDKKLLGKHGVAIAESELSVLAGYVTRNKIDLQVF